LLLFLLVFAGVTAYELRRRGLLTRETLDLYLEEGAEETADEKAFEIEPVGLAASVRAKRDELRGEAEGLRRLNKRLDAQRKELERQQALLDERIEELVQAEVPEPGIEQAPLTREMLSLIKMYESMSPEEAAAVLSNMPDSTTAQILLQMRGRQAAQIMASLNADKATEISKLLAAHDGVKKLPKPEPAEQP